MRTFRFIAGVYAFFSISPFTLLFHFYVIIDPYIPFKVDGASSADAQSQTISCSLHLDPVDTIVQEQADACICYNQAQCANECELGTDSCADDATCTDTADSFFCTCNDGYSGDGVTCSEKFAVWVAYDRDNWVSNGYVDNGHLNQDGSWVDIRGSSTQVEVGEFGTFGVNSVNRLYYKYGTHEDPYSAGPISGTSNCGNSCSTEWQLLEDGEDSIQYVSSGLNTAFILKDSGHPSGNFKLFSMENVSFDASGNMQYDLLQLDGGLINVSLHRGIAWGVGYHWQTGALTVWWGDATLARQLNYNWTPIENENLISQIEIGEFGVFGTTDSGEIYYRVGTHRNTDSMGTSWQRIPGTLTHITSGINHAYGVNSSNELFKMKSDVSFNEQGEMTWQELGPWELLTERSGSNVSAL